MKEFVIDWFIFVDFIICKYWFVVGISAEMQFVNTEEDIFNYF